MKWNTLKTYIENTIEQGTKMEQPSEQEKGFLFGIKDVQTIMADIEADEAERLKEGVPGIRDVTGKLVKVGDVLTDNVPSKGIVIEKDGDLHITSDYGSRDIKDETNADLLTQDLIDSNLMLIVGSVIEAAPKEAVS